MFSVELQIRVVAGPTEPRILPRAACASNLNEPHELGLTGPVIPSRIQDEREGGCEDKTFAEVRE